MSEEKKNIIYSAVDIQKYLSGNMDTSEMYAIEKSALDDPLLAEAIEGYEGMEQKDWSKELAALKDKLEAKENTPVVPVHSFRKWWRIAAAVVIIGSGIAITYLFNSNQSKNKTAIAKVTANDGPGVKLDSAVTVNSDSSSLGTIAKDNEEKVPPTIAQLKPGRAENTLLTEIKKQNQSDTSFIYKPSEGASYNYNNKDIATVGSANDDSHKNNSESLNINKSKNSNSQTNDAFSDKHFLSTQNQSNNPANNYINAQVVTTDDKPIAFANVSVQKNRSSVYTDAKGNFKIPAADSPLNVVITSAGYVPKKYSFKNSVLENKIVLQQDTIGVTAINSARSKSAARPMLRKEIENADTTDEDAEPAIGWDGYNNYINDNLIFPNEAKEKNIHGVVEVFVKLKENGDISQIKVNKPLCPECDAEAVRLVKEGPKWEVKKNKAKKARVNIKF